MPNGKKKSRGYAIEDKSPSGRMLTCALCRGDRKQFSKPAKKTTTPKKKTKDIPYVPARKRKMPTGGGRRRDY